MKRFISTVLCLFLFADAGLARGHKNKSRRAHGQEQTITVSGCVREGAECLVLEPFKGNQKYSIVSGSNLQVGTAYRIIGTIAEVSICQQGKALRPTKVTKLKTHCSS